MNDKTVRTSLLKYVAPESRRRFMAASAIFGGGVAATMLRGQTTTTPAQGDIDALNYALTLEFLEATFYNQFLGSATSANSGLVGTVPGNTNVFTAADALKSTVFSGIGSSVNGSIYSYLKAIRDHELAHVAALRSTIVKLGGKPVEPCSYKFDAVTSFEGFLQTAQALENTGVAAYDGAVIRIADKNLLQTAATIATVEARHAAFLNLVNSGLFSIGGVSAVAGISSIPGVGSSPFPNAFDTALSQGQVLAIAGPFLGTCATPLPAETAIATFSPVVPATISQSSFTLNATPASTVVGPATYQYSVSPGGKVPAILQNPKSSQAIIQFVNGPGLYNLVLTVTDANGVVSTMPVSLNYQP